MNPTRIGMLLLGGALLAIMGQTYLGSQIQRGADATCNAVIAAPWLTAAQAQQAAHLIERENAAQMLREAARDFPRGRFLLSAVRTGTPGQTDDRLKVSQFFRLDARKPTQTPAMLIQARAFERSGSIRALALLILPEGHGTYRFTTRCAQISGTLDQRGLDDRRSGTQQVNVLTW